MGIDPVTHEPLHKHATPPEMPALVDAEPQEPGKANNNNNDNNNGTTTSCDANSSSNLENNSTGEPRPAAPASEDDLMSYIWSDEFLSNVSWSFLAQGEECSELGFSSATSSEDGSSPWLDYEDLMNEDFGFDFLNEVERETVKEDGEKL